MKVKMLKTVMGAADGYTVVEMKAGQTFDLTGSERADELAALLLKEKFAVETTDAQLAADVRAEEQAKADAEAKKKAEHEAKKKAAEEKKLADAQALLDAKKSKAPEDKKPAGDKPPAK
jgi:colicin import membrane protein